MSDESKLNHIITLLRAELTRACSEAEQRGYLRGKADAKSEILAVLQSNIVHDEHDVEVKAHAANTKEQDVVSQFEVEIPAAIPKIVTSEGERKRAPKGLPQKLIDRVLDSRSDGVTPKEIAAAAETNNERMIKESTIRGELRKGRDAGRYEEKNKRWYLSLA